MLSIVSVIYMVLICLSLYYCGKVVKAAKNTPQAFALLRPKVSVEDCTLYQCPITVEQSCCPKPFHLCFLYLDIIFHLKREKEQFQKSSYEISLSAQQQMNGKRKYSFCTQLNFILPQRKMKLSFSGKWLKLEIKQIKQK